MYRLNYDADTNMSGRIGTILIAPAKLVQVFGKPQDEGDAYKVSGEYVFEGFDDDAGDVFTIHDYKMTSLYEEGYPDPSEFWASETPEQLSIGGFYKEIEDMKAHTKFVAWLNEQLGGDYAKVDR